MFQKRPKAIFIQLTTACNAACINCPHPFTYGKNGYHTKGIMSENVWSSLVEQLKKARYRGQVGLYLHSEPLLAKSLYDRILDINMNTSAFVVLSTNATLLNKMNRNKLIAAKPKKIHININSADKQQYEKMTGLDYDTTFENTTKFIQEARSNISIEINCPVLPGVDTHKLVKCFPRVRVNTKFWATSRGGLVQGVSAKGKRSRFLIRKYCMQPSQNFNVLWDGAVILCCADWGQESKSDFPNIRDVDLFETYSGPLMTQIRKEFKQGNYTRYKICSMCADEMDFCRRTE
ncbi:radical SAM protein [Candidatus Bathyarchaeota archaeon]|nr:radical SAM protein [Candidatus Bathyarchaeota archaeon]